MCVWVWVSSYLCVRWCPWPCVHAFVCLIFNSVISLHAKHAPRIRITIRMNSPLPLRRKIAAFLSVQLPLPFISLLSIFPFFWVCIFNYQIKQDLAAFIPPPGSVVMGKRWLFLLRALSHWEPLCSVNLWNLSSPLSGNCRCTVHTVCQHRLESL